MTVLKGLEEVDLSAPDAAEKINALAKGLLDKNAELNKSLAEVKKETRQQQIGENSAAELESLRQFKVNAEIQAAKDAQDWQKADELKTARYEDELKSKAELIAEFEKDKETRMIDGGINKLMDEYRVDPLKRGELFNSLKFQSKLVDGKAVIGEQSQSDYMKTWSETDTGKAFCMAPVNDGGDGSGGAKTPSQNQSNNKSYGEMTLAEQIAYNSNQ